MHEEFIERSMRLFESYDERESEKERNRKWRECNPEKFKESYKKYSQSPKGIYAVSKRNAKRLKNMHISQENLSQQEKGDVAFFYKNCPDGYEVDHIIPVSKGGIHHRKNLQYLASDENRKKSNCMSMSIERRLQNIERKLDDWLAFLYFHMKKE